MFSVTVPRATHLAAALPAPPADSAPRSHVVVHTADSARRRDLCELLDSWNYEGDCPETNEELAQSLARNPAVLICDAALFGQAAAQTPASADPPPIIVLGDQENAPAGSAPVAGRLPLPLRPARLRALLHHLLIEGQGGPEDDTPAITP